MPSHFTDADVEVQRGWVTWLLSHKGLRWDEGPICAQPRPPVSQQASSLMPVPPYLQVQPDSLWGQVGVSGRPGFRGKLRTLP